MTELLNQVCLYGECNAKREWRRGQSIYPLCAGHLGELPAELRERLCEAWESRVVRVARMHEVLIAAYAWLDEHSADPDGRPKRQASLLEEHEASA